MDSSFDSAEFISANYDIIRNNAISKYGTCCFVSNDLSYNNVRFDTEGRAISFDIPELSLTNGNVYLPLGNDPVAKNKREEYCSQSSVLQYLPSNHYVEINQVTI